MALFVLLGAGTAAAQPAADLDIPGFEWPEVDHTEVTLQVFHRPVRVRLLADEDGVTYHLRVSPEFAVPIYERLCEAPCWSLLEAGERRLALSVAGLDPVDLAAAVLVDEPVELLASYRSRAPARRAGWIVGAVGVVVGGALVGVAGARAPEPCGAAQNCTPPSDRRRRALMAGLVILPVSLIFELLWRRFAPRDRPEVAVRRAVERGL